MTTSKAARELLQETADRYGVTPEEITRGGRRLLHVRIEIAKALRDRGYSGTRIGAVLLRDPTTIHFYLGRTQRKPTNKTYQPSKNARDVPAPKREPRQLIAYAGKAPI